MKTAIRQRQSTELASGYSPSYRWVEVSAIVSLILVTTWLFARLAGVLDGHVWAMALGLAVGTVAADFTSGLVHWSADTWGTSETPILGRALIRPFREHHVDPKAITRHDWIEANGNNMLVAIPLPFAALFLPFNSSTAVFAGAAVAFFTAWIAATNEIHKRAHEDRPPWIFRVLQRLRIILPSQVHAIHHDSPFATYYCITTGWLNRPLQAIGFFRHLERAIVRLTGALPRQDDIGREAALEVGAKLGVLPARKR